MYRIGDLVVYGIHGVCVVKDIEQQSAGQDVTEYLVLEPYNQTGARFLVPTHNETAMAKLRKMLTQNELEDLICGENVRNDCWIENEGQRKQRYRELIGSGDRMSLMAMVHTLYLHKSRLTASGRKIHLCDENFLRDAEKLLVSEISVVMNMDTAEAKQYMRSHLQK